MKNVVFAAATEPSDETAGSPSPQHAVTAGATPAPHLVRFYEDDDLLATAVGTFLSDGLAGGDVLAVIATEPHKRAFQERLRSEGLDIERACASGQLTFVDADETLARFMREGAPDRDLFESHVGGLIADRAAAANGARLRAYGEMVDVLWKRGERKAAVRLEELWNDLQTRHSFTLLCAYAMGSFYKEPAGLHDVCGQHSHVIDEDQDGEGGDRPRLRPTVAPPQHAHKLARELAQREQVEAALRDSLRDLRHKEEELRADASERKTFERFRAAAAARTERLVKITAAVADAVTTTEVLRAVVDHVAEAVDASTAALWLVDDDGRTVRLARAIGYGASTAQQFEALSLDATPSIPALDAIRRAEPVWIHSQEMLLREYPALAASVTAGRSYRVSCLPLISQGRTLGALGITNEEAREISQDERDFLLLVARYAGQAIERLRVLEAERRSRAAADAAANRMGVLSRASRTFVGADLDLVPRLEDIARELGSIWGSCVAIGLLQADGQLHTCAVHHPVPEARQMLKTIALDAPSEIGGGILDTVAHGGSSMIVPAADAAALASRAAPAYRAFLERYPCYDTICAPLRTRGRVIGTVMTARTREDETYTPEDLELLEELAERAATPIENSRLHLENLAARSRAEQLSHFARSVVSADRVEDVFEAALDAIEGALGTNRGAILIYDESDVMRFRAWRHLSDEYRLAVEGHSPWARDVVEPEPVLVADVEGDAAMTSYLPLFRREGIGSLAFIPLVTRGRLIGKFMVYFGERHTYTANELELASSIAHHLASVTARFAAVARLEETIRYNDLLSGVLAHDLRNPLGAMMTSAQLVLMRQEGEGDRNAKPLSRILSSGQRMMRMIDQLLDVTRTRVGGGIQVEPCHANLADLCNQAVGELELAYPHWRIRREAVGEQDGAWDADRLLQIISNLVGNAGQHGQTDGEILVRSDGRRAESVSLEVHNEGVIPEPMIPSLFDPFRGSRQRRDYSRGLGLGLFIVREIARAHGGTVEVTSSPAEGTTFRVRLPRRVPHAGAIDARP